MKPCGTACCDSKQEVFRNPLGCSNEMECHPALCNQTFLEGETVFRPCTAQCLSFKCNVLTQINLDVKGCCSEWQKKR